MKYTQKVLSYDEQADLLLGRGLIADRHDLISKLETVNYFRLTGYLHPYKKPDNEEYQVGTTFETVWNRYRFDRRLRFIVLDGIERIEVAVKTEIANRFSDQFGPLGYVSKDNLPLIYRKKHKALIQKIEIETKQSRDLFVKRFFEKYGDNHSHLPLWMAVEIMSFGSILTFFKGLAVSIKQDIAKKYEVHDSVFESWLTALNVVRNICAHHSRLWNRELGCKPKMPAKHVAWHTPRHIPNTRIFGILSIINFMLQKIIPTSHWKERLKELLRDFPQTPLKDMGFIQEWETHKIWQ